MRRWHLLAAHLLAATPPGPRTRQAAAARVLAGLLIAGGLLAIAWGWVR